MRKGVLLVISSPSGGGKGTIISELTKRRDDIYVSISATSRNMREGDKEGVNYFFKTRSEFEKMIEDGDLLEWVEFCDNYYGTPKRIVQNKLDEGYNVILEIEVIGAINIKRMFPEAVLIFILPPTYSTLVDRLKKRGTDSIEAIEKRTKRAIEEVKNIYDYDYLVINDEVEKAVNKVESIIDAERAKPYRNTDKIDKFLKN